MPRRRIRRSLAWGLAATLILPIVLAIVLGLGGLLQGLGDEVGAAACRRIGLAIGVVWGGALAVTTACNAAAILEHESRDHGRRARRGGGRRRHGRPRLRRPLESRSGHGEPERPA